MAAVTVLAVLAGAHLAAEGRAGEPEATTPEPAVLVAAAHQQSHQQSLQQSLQQSHHSDIAGAMRITPVPVSAGRTHVPVPRTAHRVGRGTAGRTPSARRQTAPPVAASGNLASVVGFALAQVGTPYRRGGAGPGGYDCSGLVSAAYLRIGVRLPRTSQQIAARGRVVPRSQVRPGDVLAWPGHVAIALGGSRMVHAPRPGTAVTVAAIYGTPRVIRLVG
jgi:cell wall-associated NlpC family hydrolase